MTSSLSTPFFAFPTSDRPVLQVSQSLQGSRQHVVHDSELRPCHWPELVHLAVGVSQPCHGPASHCQGEHQGQGKDRLPLSGIFKCVWCYVNKTVRRLLPVRCPLILEQRLKQYEMFLSEAIRSDSLKLILKLYFLTINQVPLESIQRKFNLRKVKAVGTSKGNHSALEK